MPINKLSKKPVSVPSPSQPATAPAEQAPGEPIDYAYLARFTCGNADLEREVLEIFATQTPVYVAHLRTTVARAEDAGVWRPSPAAPRRTPRGIGGGGLMPRGVGARRCLSGCTPCTVHNVFSRAPERMDGSSLGSGPRWAAPPRERALTEPCCSPAAARPERSCGRARLRSGARETGAPGCATVISSLRRRVAGPRSRSPCRGRTQRPCRGL